MVRLSAQHRTQLALSTADFTQIFSRALSAHNCCEHFLLCVLHTDTRVGFINASSFLYSVWMDDTHTGLCTCIHLSPNHPFDVFIFELYVQMYASVLLMYMQVCQCMCGPVFY